MLKVIQTTGYDVIGGGVGARQESAWAAKRNIDAVFKRSRSPESGLSYKNPYLIIFSNDQLHIILKRMNVKFCEHSSFC